MILNYDLQTVPILLDHTVISKETLIYCYVPDFFVLGDRFALRMRFIDHVFDDQVVDHFTLKMILPERVDSIHFDSPFAVQRGPNEVVKTYLDTVGRTVIVAHKANLVEQHIREFTVST